MRSISSTIRFATLGLAGCALAVACGREPTGAPREQGGIRWSRSIAFNAEFPAGFSAYQQSTGLANQVASAATAFTKVRIILNNSDGSVALDTVVNFPAGVEELTVPLSVQLPLNAPSTGVALGLTLNYQNAAGQTVFSGGPVSVNAVPATPGVGPPPPAPVNVPLSYTGVGSTAAGVRITPKSLTLKTAEAFEVSAVAIDASGAVIPNTPIVFVVENSALAQVNAATGTGSTGNTRGVTRVIAQLLTNQQDAATLTINSPPAQIAAVSGGGQTAPVSSALPQPVVVKVTAKDGGPAQGVSVAFAAANGGSVGSATVVTGADGLASTTWSLGADVGAQSLTATAAALTGSPVIFSATGRSVEPVRLTFTQGPPASSVAGAALAPAIVVSALDAAGDVAKKFSGAVTLSLGDGAPAGSVLFGTRTATAVDGVAIFTDLSLRMTGAYALAASSGSLEGSLSSGVTVTHGPATRLTFQNYPSAGAGAGATLDPVSVVARDAFGNTATTFTSAVTLTLQGGSSLRAEGDTAASAAVQAAQSAAGALGDLSVTANAVAGVATFPGLRLTNAAGSQFSASAAGLTSVSGPVFQVNAGAPASIMLVSGGAQTALGGATLAAPVIVKVVDSFGNGVSGVTVSFVPAAGSGTVAPASQLTTSTGLAQATWTLGASAGPMTLNVSATGVPGAPLSVPATSTKATGPAPATRLSFTTQPATSAAGAAMTNVVVTAYDADGAVATGYTEFINLALGTNPSAASFVRGSPRVAAVAGVATFTGLGLNKVGSGYTLVARDEVLSATSATFNVTPGAPASIVADSGDGQSATVGTALANPFVARVTDQFGNPVPGATVSWNVSAGTLGSVTTTTDANGRVRALLTLGGAAGQVTTSVAATIGDIAPAVFTATALSGDAVQLVFTTLPTEAQAGATFAPGVVVTAKDGNGNVVTSFTGTVSLALDVGGGASLVAEGGPTLGGTTSVAAVAGVATFSNLSMTKASSGYAIVATSGPLSAKSGKFRIKAGPARRHLVDDGHGQSNTVGKKLGKKFVVLATDEFGNAAGGAAVTWTNVNGKGELEEQVLLTDSTGRASAGLKLGNGAGKHRVSAAVDGVADPAIEFESNAVADKAKKLKLVGGPSNGSKVKAGAKFSSPLKVEAQDQFGNVDSSFSGNVSLRFAANPGADTAVAGGNDVNATGGVAHFTNANVRKTGKGYRLRVTSADVTADSTETFEIEAGPAKRVFADSGHGQSSTVGRKLGKKFVIRATDEFDNPAAGAGVSWTNVLGAGEIEEQTALTDSTGRASAALKLGTGAGKHRVAASIVGEDGVAFAFEADAIADKAKKLKVVGGPSGGSKVKAGAKFASPLTVQAQDQFGNVDLTFAGSVSLRFAANPGADTAVAGGNDVAAANGTASFTNANIRKSGKGYRLRVTSADLTADSTDTFEIEPGPAKKIRADSGHGQSNTVGKGLAKKLVLSAADEFDNVVSGATVTWTNLTANGELEETSATTDSTGRARAALKLGTGAGKHRISAAVDGSGEPAIVFEADAIADKAKKLKVVGGPSGGSKVKAGAKFASPLTVQAQDQYGNVDLTFSGNVSLRFAANPGADTAVAGGNDVTAANGTASFTNANIRKTGKGYRLRVTSADVSADSTDTFEIEAGPAKKIRADSGHGQSNTVGKGLAKKLVLAATDEFDNVVIGAGVTWTNLTANGDLEETSLATDSTGRARTSLKLGTGAGKHRISAAVAGSDEPAIVFEADAIADKAKKLKVVGGPSGGSKVKAGAKFASPLTVQAQDQHGNVDLTFTGNVSLRFAANPGADTAVAGGNDVSAAGGIAQFTNANIRKTGKGYRLRVSSSDVTADSTDTFEIEAGPAKKIRADSGHGQSNTVGKGLAKKLVLAATDEFDNIVIGAPVTWTVANGNGALEDKSLTTDSTGRARAAFKLGTGSGKQKVTAAIDGAGEPPVEFESDAIADKAKKLVVKGGPTAGAKVKAGAHFPSMQVEAQDEYGNIDLTFDGTVSLGLAANPGADSAIAGSKSGKASAGVATFTGANLRKTGAGYRIRASADAVLSDSTGTFTIDPGPVKHVFADSGAAQSKTVGNKLDKKLVIRATDEFGNIAPGAAVTWTNVSGGGSLTETTTTTDEQGRARTALTLSNGSGKHRVRATVEGLETPTEFEADAVAGAAKKLRVTSGPTAGSNKTAGSSLAVRVEAVDEFGNIDLTYAGAVALGFATNPGADTAVAGDKLLNASGGIAQFTTSNVRKAGSGYRLRATSTSLSADSTEAFNITAATATKIIRDAGDNGNGQSGQQNKELNKPFVASVLDDYDNAVSGASVTWTVTDGNGTIEAALTTTVVTDTGGKARVTLKLGNKGKHKVTAAINGSTVEFEADAQEGAPPTA
jgi:hypothetical protein